MRLKNLQRGGIHLHDYNIQPSHTLFHRLLILASRVLVDFGKCKLRLPPARQCPLPIKIVQRKGLADVGFPEELFGKVAEPLGVAVEGVDCGQARVTKGNLDVLVPACCGRRGDEKDWMIRGVFHGRCYPQASPVSETSHGSADAVMGPHSVNVASIVSSNTPISRFSVVLPPLS